MSARRARGVLRGAAIAIAVLAWVDPALTGGRRQPLVAIVPTRDAEKGLVDATRTALGTDATVTIAPDPEADAWVVVACIGTPPVGDAAHTSSARAGGESSAQHVSRPSHSGPGEARGHGSEDRGRASMDGRRRAHLRYGAGVIGYDPLDG